MKVTSPQSGSRFQPRKLSRMNSALILPKRRIASTAAACIWVTSDLPSSPLIVALMIGPDASMMVNAMPLSLRLISHSNGKSSLSVNRYRLRQIDYVPMSALTVSGLLLLELDIHPLACKRELASLNRGHEVHNHTVLILHRRATRAAALRGLRFN